MNETEKNDKMNNVEAIRRSLIAAELDAVLITDEKNQRYATGFAFTDGAVLVTRKSAFLFTDSRYIEAASMTVADNITLRLFGAGKRLSQLIKTELDNERVERLGGEEGTLPHGQYLAYENLLGRKLIPCQHIFSSLRASKTAEEQEYMRRAQAIAELALSDVLQIIKPGVSERDIAAEITYRLLKHGGEGNSFDPIAVTGKNSSMPHGVPGDALVQNGDFVTMDFGASYMGYCSDMTRTVAVGYATDEMKQVYDTVLKAQLAAIAITKAGVPGHDVDAAARKVIAEAGYGEYFGHGYGHSLGLEIHENPSPNGGNKEPLPARAVCSAEPGIYLPGKFGVRIEDVTILTEDGCEVITGSPKNLMIL